MTTEPSGRSPCCILSLGISVHLQHLCHCMLKAITMRGLLCVLCRTSPEGIAALCGAMLIANIFLGTSNASTVQPIAGQQRTILYRSACDTMCYHVFCTGQHVLPCVLYRSAYVTMCYHVFCTSQRVLPCVIMCFHVLPCILYRSACVTTCYHMLPRVTMW